MQGKDWYLKDETLVIHVYRDPSDDSVRKRMRRILRTNEINAKLIGPIERGQSPFPPRWSGLFKSASSEILFDECR